MSELLQWDDRMIKVKSESDFSAALLYFPFLLVNLSMRLSWLFKLLFSWGNFNQKTLPTVWFLWHFNANLEIYENLLNLQYFRQNITNIILKKKPKPTNSFYTEKFYWKAVETSLVDVSVSLCLQFLTVSQSNTVSKSSCVRCGCWSCVT